MSRSQVYTLHLIPPLEHAKHYTGATRDLPHRLVDHRMGRGARMLQVQLERGGNWVVAQTEEGGFQRERQLKQRGASRRCEVCKSLKERELGDLSDEEALSRAGWGHASPFERKLLLDVFGLEEAPEPLRGPERTLPPVPKPIVLEPAASEEPFPITDELVEAVDRLCEGWRADAQAKQQAEAAQTEPEPRPGPDIPCPAPEPESWLAPEPRPAPAASPEPEPQMSHLGQN